MNFIADKKALFRSVFLAIAILIVVGSLLFSHFFVKGLSLEERNKIEIWAEATKEMASSDDNANMNLIAHILKSNTTIPVILFDKKENYYTSTNIELPETDKQDFLRKKAASFEKKHKPIIIEVEDFDQYVYYDDSYTLKRLQLYPYVLLGILSVFIFIAFFALFTTMRMEQNRLWVGLSKETAHQLGTPISSLMAWVEYLRLNNLDESIAKDMEKDIDRLQVITDRFSKIGSEPVLERADLSTLIQNTVSYLQKRISSKIYFDVSVPDLPVYVALSEPLMSWVIENLTRNAADAMSGIGTIRYNLFVKDGTVSFTIQDTGKGIPKSQYKTIFNTGYTTKARGWGLGLSLVKRIIESYHKGKVYVKSSEIGVGTTFCIELKNLE